MLKQNNSNVDTGIAGTGWQGCEVIPGEWYVGMDTALSTMNKYFCLVLFLFDCDEVGDKYFARIIQPGINEYPGTVNTSILRRPTPDEWLCFHRLEVGKANSEMPAFNKVENTECTCPGGDGSLHWPCPVHPPTKTLIEYGMQCANEVAKWPESKRKALSGISASACLKPEEHEPAYMVKNLVALAAMFFNDHSDESLNYYQRKFEECEEAYSKDDRCMFLWMFARQVWLQRQAIINKQQTDLTTLNEALSTKEQINQKLREEAIELKEQLQYEKAECTRLRQSHDETHDEQVQIIRQNDEQISLLKTKNKIVMEQNAKKDAEVKRWADSYWGEALRTGELFQENGELLKVIDGLKRDVSIRDEKIANWDAVLKKIIKLTNENEEQISKLEKRIKKTQKRLNARNKNKG